MSRQQRIQNMFATREFQIRPISYRSCYENPNVVGKTLYQAERDYVSTRTLQTEIFTK